eukprot:1847158-Rhodomonas_salina.1
MDNAEQSCVSSYASRLRPNAPIVVTYYCICSYASLTTIPVSYAMWATDIAYGALNLLCNVR